MKHHRVYFYVDGFSVAEPIVEFVKKGLEQQEMVIVIATDQRRSDLKTRLLANKVIGLDAPHDDHYVTLDASMTLSLFMRNGWPDEQLFFKVIPQIIESAAREKPLRIYGEMVAILCADANPLAAIHLERLWNKLALNRDFSLLCGYPASAFRLGDTKYFLREICACHAESIKSDNCTEKAA